MNIDEMFYLSVSVSRSGTGVPNKVTMCMFGSVKVSHALFHRQIPNNLWSSPPPGGSVVSPCMLPRGSPPCVTSYSHSPRSAAGAGDHGYVGFPNQQNQFGHVSLNNFFSTDSLLTPAANGHHVFETKPEFERRSSSIAVLRMKAKEHAANISWAM